MSSQVRKGMRSSSFFVISSVVLLACEPVDQGNAITPPAWPPAESSGNAPTPVRPLPPGYGAFCNTDSDCASILGTTCAANECTASCAAGVTCPLGTLCGGSALGFGCFQECANSVCTNGAACATAAVGRVCGVAYPSDTTPDAGSQQRAVSSVEVDPLGTSPIAFTTFDIKSDSRGTLHVAYDATYRPRYGTCSSGCERASSWSWVSLSTERAEFYLQLAVAPDGNEVYMTWEDAGISGNEVRIAHCVSQCTRESSWTVATLLRTSVGSGLSKGQTLQVSASGRVHLLTEDSSGLNYLTCSSGCTDASNWSRKTIFNRVVEQCVSALGAAGTVVVACADGGAIHYLECSPTTLNCAAEAWTSVDLFFGVAIYGDLSLATTNAARHISFVNQQRKQVVISCSSDCDVDWGWDGVAWAAPVGATTATSALVVDSTNAWLSVRRDDGVAVTLCSAGSTCWSPSPNWRRVSTVEAPGDLASTLRTAPPNCSDQFAEVWGAERPHATATSDGLFVLTEASDAVGCTNNQATYVQTRNRLHLAFVPRP